MRTLALYAYMYNNYEFMYCANNKRNENANLDHAILKERVCVFVFPFLVVIGFIHSLTN